MMQYPLTLVSLLERAGKVFPEVAIVSRRPDNSTFRYCYADWYRRARALAAALQGNGLRPGDRVATLGWNHWRHLEAYFAIPLAGGVLHTLNPRLSPQDLTYIMNHADDRMLLVDDVLWPVFDRFRHEVKPRHVIVWGHGAAVPEGAHDYEQLIAPEMPTFAIPRIEENQAAGICYTSGTTGRPKGVLYSHRALVLHSLGSALTDSLGIAQTDSVMPVVPMFHANCWAMMFAAPIAGASLVMPGAKLDGASVFELLDRYKVTCTAAVPTVWLMLLQHLEASGSNLPHLRKVVIGGSACPRAMAKTFQDVYEDFRNREIPIPFFVCGDDVPGRPVRAGMIKCVFISLHVGSVMRLLLSQILVRHRYPASVYTP